MGNGKEEELPPISGYWQRGNSSYAFLNETRVTVGVHQSRQESILDSNQVGQLLSLKRSKTHHWKRMSFQLPCNLHLICFFFVSFYFVLLCMCVCCCCCCCCPRISFYDYSPCFFKFEILIIIFFYHLLLGAKRIDRLRFFSFFLSFLLLSFPGCCCCCCFGCCCCCWISSASFTFTTCCSSCCSSCCCWEKEGRRAVDKKNGLTEFSMNSNIAGEKMVGAALHER